MALLFNGSIVDFSSSVDDITISSNTIWSENTTKYYRNVTINSGVTLTVHRTCDFRVNGTLTINGTLASYKNERTTLATKDGSSASWGSWQGGNGNKCWGGGGGASISVGGEGGSCSSGSNFNNEVSGKSGTAYGDSSLGVSNWTDFISSNYIGGKAAGGNHSQSGDNSGGNDTDGTTGASPLKVIAKSIIVNGTISAKADNATDASWGNNGTRSRGGGGGGGGGVIWVIAETESGSGTYTTSGGSGGRNACNLDSIGPSGGGYGGNGAIRRDIALKSSTVSIVGSTTYSVTSVISDTTGPVFSNLSKSVTTAGPNQNQVVTVTITDSQTTVQTPTAALSGSGIGGTVTLTSFTSNVATFTISGHTGTGTATLTISASDSGGNTSTTTTSWAVDSSYPAGFVPFFGSSTTDWILDGTAAPSGLTLSGTTYTITAATDPTQSYSYNLKNLTISSGYSLFWRGQLILKVNNTANINGLLGQASVNPSVYGSGFSGGFRGGRAGFSAMASEGLSNFTDWGEKGYGWDSSLSYGANGGSAGYRPPNDQVDNVGAGGGGSHLAKIPLANDTYSSVAARGVAPGNGGGGGGGGGNAAGTWQGGGMGGHGGAGCILYAQTLSGTGSIDCSGSMGAQGVITGDDRRDGAPGGGGAGGHVVVITGTTSFSGNIKSKGAVAQSTQAGSSWTGSGGSGGDGYVNWYYNSKSADPTFSPAAINTTKIDSTIPATISSNQSSGGANISYQYAKSGTVQRISIAYSKTMTDSTVKIALSGAATLAATTMTKNTSLTNTYYYDYTCSSGNGTITYKINGSDGVNNPATEISGTWILDNTAPVISTSISPNKKYFSPGEIFTVTATITEENLLNGNPTMTFSKGSNYFGQDPPSATLSYSSLSGSTYTYTTSFIVPVASGALSSTITATDFSGNTSSYSGLISANTGLIISQASSIIWF